MLIIAPVRLQPCHFNAVKMVFIKPAKKKKKISQKNQQKSEVSIHSQNLPSDTTRPAVRVGLLLLYLMTSSITCRCGWMKTLNSMNLQKCDHSSRRSKCRYDKRQYFNSLCMRLCLYVIVWLHEVQRGTVRWFWLAVACLYRYQLVWQDTNLRHSASSWHCTYTELFRTTCVCGHTPSSESPDKYVCLYVCLFLLWELNK